MNSLECLLGNDGSNHIALKFDYAGPFFWHPTRYAKNLPSFPRVCAVLTVNGRVPSLPMTHIEIFGAEKFSGTRQLLAN